MKKTLTYCAPGSGRHETYGETLKLSLEANKKQVNVIGALAIFYSIEQSLGQGLFCRHIEFSRFAICMLECSQALGYGWHLARWCDLYTIPI